MTTIDIELISIEHSSAESPSYDDTKMKSNSSWNSPNLRKYFTIINQRKMDCESRKTTNVSMTRKIRMAKYIVYLIYLLLLFIFIFIMTRFFYSILVSQITVIVFAAFTSMAVLSGTLIVSFTTSKSSSMPCFYDIFV